MEDNWFEDHSKLNEKQKRVLYNELKKFDEYGKAVYQEQDLNEIAKKFEVITEYAKAYLNENASDSFDQVTLNRNIKEIEKKVRKFKKEAEKVQQHQTRLTALYDDIGMKFNRYFEVGGSEEPKTKDNTEKIKESNKPKLTETKLRGLVREELSRVLNEQQVEYDRQKMLGLMQDDSFIEHVIRDEARNPQNPDDRVLRRIFNAHVLGDSVMEREYKKQR